MNIQELTVGMVATCCYVLSKEDRDDCIVIDPGGEAERIRKAVSENLWDEKRGIYAPWNLLSGRRQISWGDGSLDSEVGYNAFISCPSLLPLFAGIAEPEQAESMIRKYVLSPEHFRSRFGIRSLSRSSEYYNNARWGNPPRFGDWSRLTNSNWQGPV